MECTVGRLLTLNFFCHVCWNPFAHANDGFSKLFQVVEFVWVDGVHQVFGRWSPWSFTLKLSMEKTGKKKEGE